MIIKTIVCDMDNSRVYISPRLWKYPKFAAREGQLLYLGMLGWYPDSNHKKLYEILDDQFEISKMYPGEYMEIEFEIEDDLL